MCVMLYNMCDDMKFDYTVSEYTIYIYILSISFVLWEVNSALPM